MARELMRCAGSNALALADLLCHVRFRDVHDWTEHHFTCDFESWIEGGGVVR